MTLEESIKRLTDEAQRLTDRATWLKNHAEQFAGLEGLSVSAYCDGVDFDHLSHTEIVRVMLAFPGKWEKSVNCAGDKIDYEIKIDGQRIRCWAGEPPPSCKIVEVEEFVPAGIKKVRKIVCPETTVEDGHVKDMSISSASSEGPKTDTTKHGELV